MRESLMYGSVRGARGNSRPYRLMLHSMSPVVREVEAVDAGKWKLVPACTELDISRLRRARNDHDQVED
jgi:hypothetical protein